MEKVYQTDLNTKAQQQLFTNLKMAITDIILSCCRKANNNLDSSLTNPVFNTQAILKIIRENNIKTIYFSSRFTEKLFKKQFIDVIQKHPTIEFITLPSPSPRYAAMSKLTKIVQYKKLLPKLFDKKHQQKSTN